MSEKTTPDLDGFLRELGGLSTRYGLYIGGCGCCGSPMIMSNTDPVDLAEGLTASDDRDGRTMYTCKKLTKP